MSKEDGLTYYKDGETEVTVPWRLDDGRTINLLTPRQYEILSLGTELICINGKTYIKSLDSNNPESKNYIDDETRYGRLAFGLLDKD